MEDVQLRIPGNDNNREALRNSCQTSGQSKLTGINLIQLWPTKISCLKLEIKIQVVLNRMLIMHEHLVLE